MAENNAYNSEDVKEKVIKGSVKVEKKKLGKRVVDFLFSNKIDDMGNYLVETYLKPGVGNLLYSIVVGAARMMFGRGGYPQGQYIPGQGYQPGGRDPYQYNTYSNQAYAQPQPVGYGQRVSISDVSFDTKDDAYLVLDRMAREISRYQKVRVADFYTFAGVTGQEGNWALQANGWYTLGDAHPILRTDGRWIIDFPPVQNLR